MAVARRAPPILASIAGAFLIGLLIYGVSAQSASRTLDELVASKRYPRAPQSSHALPRLGEAGRASLDSFRGRVLVLNFWASWCAPCREEGPVLERAWLGARGMGLLLLGLNMQDVTGDALDFARQLGVTYLNVRDRGNDVARAYGVTGLPETFFISATGHVVGHVIGAVTPDQLRAGMAAASAGRPLGVRSGGERRKTR